MANITRCVLTTGSREFTSRKLVHQELSLLTPSYIMHGGAMGADRLVSEVIHGERMKPETGLKGLIELRVPYLNTHGQKGGHVRNRYMLNLLEGLREVGWECWAIAFHYDIKNPTPGTAGMVRLLQGADFSIVHVDEQHNQVY